ncbi:hypothetical protein NE237_023969 [Protea cynaroides]|uniref:Uncharacterized protein n=1 Tax=Protea cynaroides TaxID=273540 RepID=A0A9Q0HG30_9MAGN|nr:hypothetical protein NE237_023969 [Protea cynaroides]
MVRKGGVVFDESPPDDFDPANPYKDPVAMLEMREHIVREKWIDIETAKILREKLKWCYRVEGINHLQKRSPSSISRSQGLVRLILVVLEVTEIAKQGSIQCGELQSLSSCSAKLIRDCHFLLPY